MADMTRAALSADLQAMLMDAAQRFQSGDFNRHLDHAAGDLSRVRPRVVSADLTVSADVAVYDAPADLLKPISMDWGRDELRCRMPWDTNWIGPIPRFTVTYVDGLKKLMLQPAPTFNQVSRLGVTAPYRYSAVYSIGDLSEDTTVAETDRPLLLIRALADAMQDLASRGVSKPVTLGGKAGISVPRNGSPAALSDDLMQRFERMAQ